MDETRKIIADLEARNAYLCKLLRECAEHIDDIENADPPFLFIRDDDEFQATFHGAPRLGYRVRRALDAIEGEKFGLVA